MKETLIKTFFSCPNISNSSSLITFSSHYGRHDAHKSFSLITRTSSIISSLSVLLVGFTLFGALNNFFLIFCVFFVYLHSFLIIFVLQRFKLFFSFSCCGVKINNNLSINIISIIMMKLQYQLMWINEAYLKQIIIQSFFQYLMLSRLLPVYAGA